MSEPRLPFDEEPVASRDAHDARPKFPDAGPSTHDTVARRFATDPLRNVVLEASAGTGKTWVLVERYVNLLRAGVDPDHILAMTFTRKAAAEMRQRIIARLRQAAQTSQSDARRWRELRDRLSDVAISTIDAFCLSIVREFPLEADLDPGFTLADETEIPRLIDEALDRALRTTRDISRTDADVALVLVLLGERRLRSGLAALLNRRLVARDVLRKFLEFGPRDLTPHVACRRAAARLQELLADVPGGLSQFLTDGPLGHPQFAMLAADVNRLCTDPAAWRVRKDPPYVDVTGTHDDEAEFRSLVDRLRAYLLTQDGKPRKAKGFGQSEFKKDHCASDAAWRRHRDVIEAIAPRISDTVRAFRRDMNVVLSRGIWRVFAVAEAQYRRTLDTYGVLDFSEVLARAIQLLRQMEEFSRSRFKLEARYRHVLVDEFQDTSRPQWELVSLLIRSWGEGLGAASDAVPPSIFVVGDRKQSIYGFRDAEVALLDEATTLVETLRPDGGARQAISVSFRAVPGLLVFVNDLFTQIGGSTDRTRLDRFRYEDDDRFPIEPCPDAPVGFLTGTTVETAAEAVAEEVVRLLSGDDTVRDPTTGTARPIEAGDIAVLFRSRDSHREYEAALDRRGILTYVYKGLGFFDAAEIQDAMALLRFLADPTSNLRAAALLRSRIVRISDRAVALLAPGLAAALMSPEPPAGASHLDAEDAAVFGRVREALPRWLGLVDVVPPSELLDRVLDETAYTYETRGPRRTQARENLKKLGALVRRIQNRGYATLERIADHLEQLALGDESNAVIDAKHAVSLMTVHAAKGLEFPIVFVVNLGRGTAGPRAPVRVTMDGRGSPSVAIGDFESDADEDGSARDREESKRLLYVALTRARDRLYLSGVVKDGRFRPGRGSLGEVLPASIIGRIEQGS